MIPLQKKHTNINIRITDEQKRELEDKCNDLELTMSEYCRLKIFSPDKIDWEETKNKLKKLLLEESE